MPTTNENKPLPKNQYLGIELGSTRIKSVLIGEDFQLIAEGNHQWENRLEDGYWVYSLEDVWQGVQHSVAELSADMQSRYGTPLTRVNGVGVSAMMHGYLAFDKNDDLLVPFRTWRNTTTEQAAKALTQLFSFNIPQRWSVAHLYQAVLNQESHVEKVAFLTTLAGYVHWQLTGEKVLGVGDASGVFPIDSESNSYHAGMLQQFDDLVEERRLPWRLEDILPSVLNAGDNAGTLTEKGARLLDPTGTLQPGAAVCPPEGDAGTGMVATNSITERTGNVSAGTSIFAMVVLEKPLADVHMEIDIVTTPDGKPVAMVHCNNCTSDIDAWIALFKELYAATDTPIKTSALYDAFYHQALKGETDGGGLLSYNYLSGEPITHLDEGRPLLVRQPDSRLSFANFARTLLLSTMTTLKIGMGILTDEEGVRLDQIQGHGGLFKTKDVGQQLMAGALNVPVSVMDSAAEGGAWGIAILAAYRANRQKGESLTQYLNDNVFAAQKTHIIKPQANDVEGFGRYLKRFKKGLEVEKTAVQLLDY